MEVSALATGQAVGRQWFDRVRPRFGAHAGEAIRDRVDFLATLGITRDFSTELPPEIYPTGLAPFIRLVEDQRAADAGHFRLLPVWRRELPYM